MWIRLIIFFSACNMILNCVPWYAHHVDSLTTRNKGMILFENFDGIKDQTVLTKGDRIRLNKAFIVVNGKHGSALQLIDGTYAEIDAAESLNAKSGTISFWIRPLWEKDDKYSHTFISMRWADKKQSYMAISQGWWEPLGANRLYFILSNQEFMHCSVPFELDVSTWTMVTVVWKSGNDGYCKLFVDGEKIAEFQKSFTGEYTSAGPIFLGSDMGSTDRRNRNANAMLDELVIFNRPFSEREILQSYEVQEDDTLLSYEKKLQWLIECLNLSLEHKRNSEGKILESRVILDEDIHWAVSKEATDKILTRVKKAGFNVYIPCVWHGKGTHYPSTLSQPDTRLEKVIADGYDPLAYLIEKAHSMGIEIHPWFTVVRRETEQYPQFYDNGTPKDAYNVHNKEFRQFIINLMLDVVRRYNVDGINLDYIRAMGICMSIDCMKDYREKTGHNLQTDYYLRYVIGPARERIQKWQDDAVVDIVANFAIQARLIRPNIVISVDGHPKSHNMIRPLEGRDEVLWANNDLIDVIFNMDYRQKIDYEMADAVRDDLIVKEKMTFLFGNYDKIDGKANSRPGNIIAKYAEFAQRRWSGSGVAFYIYQMISDDQIHALRKGPFREDAIPYWAGLTMPMVNK